ncbi:hypothetical protein AABB24_025660 [Solanum stoloniferum]|uniref:Uncharacterized protein n=1 Tax=Solanum stoloniferum TaxID=62892 RepID=A0ABD2SC80_9SOLN
MCNITSLGVFVWFGFVIAINSSPQNRLTRLLFALFVFYLFLFVFVLGELWHLRNSLPDRVVVHRIEERLSALGNCIACNDNVSLAHVDLDKVIYLLAILCYKLECIFCRSLDFNHVNRFILLGAHNSSAVFILY